MEKTEIIKRLLQFDDSESTDTSTGYVEVGKSVDEWWRRAFGYETDTNTLCNNKTGQYDQFITVVSDSESFDEDDLVITVDLMSECEVRGYTWINCDVLAPHIKRFKSLQIGMFNEQLYLYGKGINIFNCMKVLYNNYTGSNWDCVFIRPSDGYIPDIQSIYENDPTNSLGYVIDMSSCDSGYLYETDLLNKNCRSLVFIYDKPDSGLDDISLHLRVPSSEQYEPYENDLGFDLYLCCDIEQLDGFDVARGMFVKMSNRQVRPVKDNVAWNIRLDARPANESDNHVGVQLMSGNIKTLFVEAYKGTCDLRLRGFEKDVRNTIPMKKVSNTVIAKKINPDLTNPKDVVFDLNMINDDYDDYGYNE